MYTSNPGLRLKASARRIVRRLVRRLLVTSSIQIPPGFDDESEFTIRYDIVSSWHDNSRQSSWSTPAVRERFLRGIEGLDTFDFNVAKQSPSVAFGAPIVRDNLTALGRIGLSEAILLDFGCGNGLYGFILKAFPATTRWKYVGADVNAELIKWCRDIQPEARFEVIQEGRPLPFRDDEFDIVLASGVISLIADYGATLSELHRVSRNYVVLSRVPVWKYNPGQIVHQHVCHEWGEEEHLMHVFNREAFEVFLKRLGFSILFRDYADGFYYVADVSEPGIDNLYLLQKVRAEH